MFPPGDGSGDPTTTDPTNDPNSPSYDPYAYNGPNGGANGGDSGLPAPLDPSLDPNTPENSGNVANYDASGNYIGPGAYDAQGNWVDPYGSGWQGGNPVGVPDTGVLVQGQDPNNPSSGSKPNAGQVANASKAAAAAGAAGKAIGAATNSAAQNRLTAGKLTSEIGNTNITGQSSYEQELQNRAKMEATQRGTDLSNIARQSLAANPRVSPFDPTGGPTYSPAYQQALLNLQQQGSTDLASAPQYSTTKQPPLPPYTPINPAQFTTPSTLEQVGNIASPILSTIGTLGPLLNTTPQVPPVPPPSTPPPGGGTNVPPGGDPTIFGA
jgi:hypothetical protein